MKDIRICMVGQAEIPGRIGMSTRIWELSRNLSKLGVEVHIVCSLRDGLTQKEEQVDEISIHRVPEPRWPSVWMASSMIPFAWLKILEIAQENDIDIIHGHMHLGTLSAILAKNKLGTPVIFDVHGLGLEEFVYSGICSPNGIRAHIIGYVDRLILARSDLLIVISETLRDIFASRGVQHDRMRLIPNGVNTILFNAHVSGIRIREQYGISLDAPVIIHVGWLQKWAGATLIIRTAKKVLEKCPNAQFLFVGSGPELPSLRSLCSKLDILDQVTFCGAVPYHTVPEYIAASNIGIISLPSDISTHVASPIKVLEYMAMEKPVISTFAQETSKLIERGQAGIVTESSPVDISNAVLGLISNPETAKEMGIKGRVFVEDKYNWIRLTRDLVGIYSNLLTR